MTEPQIAKKGPYAVDVTAGQQYWWCACGRSAKQPFCDGSHKGTAFTPVGYTADADKTAYFCGCKRSDGKPFCDGSHNRI